MYDNAINYWLRWLGRNKRDRNAPADKDVRDYKQSLLSDGYSKYTTNRYVNTVVRFYRWCAATNIWNAIGAGIRNERTPFYCKRPLTVEETARLLDSVDRTTVTGLRDFTIMTLMLSNGLRPCEVRNLRMCDIVEDDYGVRWLMLLRKGHQSRDCKVKLSRKMWEQLDTYIRRRKVSDGYVFVSHCKGTPSIDRSLSETRIEVMIKNRLRSVHLTDDKLCAYSLRHTFATRLLEMGKSVDEVSWQMGHSSQAVTLRYMSMAREERMLKSRTIEEWSDMLWSGIGAARNKKTILSDSDTQGADCE